MAVRVDLVETISLLEPIGRTRLVEPIERTRLAAPTERFLDHLVLRPVTPHRFASECMKGVISSRIFARLFDTPPVFHASHTAAFGTRTGSISPVTRQACRIPFKRRVLTLGAWRTIPRSRR